MEVEPAMTADEARRRRRASKDRERKWARIFGSDRWINTGHGHSDSNPDCSVSLEVTQTIRPWAQAIRGKSKQAETNAKAEHREPVIVASAPGQAYLEDWIALKGKTLRAISEGRIVLDWRADGKKAA
jgi:hypothetical protein